MCTFDKFLKEIEYNILRENLTHVATVTDINRMTLVRCFRENKSVPSLPVLSKLMVFLDWKIKFTLNEQSFEAFNIEIIAREALSHVDINILKNKSDVSLLQRFLNDHKGLSLYKIFTVFPKLGLKISISKPDYQLISEENYHAVYG